MAKASHSTDGENDGNVKTKKVKKLHRQLMRKNLLRSRQSSEDPSLSDPHIKSSKKIKSTGTTARIMNTSKIYDNDSKVLFNDNNLNGHAGASTPGNLRNLHNDENNSSFLLDSENFTPTVDNFSDTLMTNTTALGLKPSKKCRDATWEQAVEKARGLPDGAEKSFGVKKSKESAPNMSITGKKIAKVGKKKFLLGPVTKQKLGKLKLKKTKQSMKTKDETDSSVKRKLNISDDDPETPKKKQRFTQLKRKDRRTIKRMLKNNQDKIQAVKKLWNELQRHDLKKERREEICRTFAEMVKGNCAEFAYAHDTGRTIQCLLKYGNAEQRQMVFTELKDLVVKMAGVKYARHLVKKILKYGTKQQKNFIYRKLHGHVRRLIRNREAAEVIEYAYNEWANASQRLGILEEFYGPSFMMFKTNETRCLGDIMTSQPDKREMILRNMKEALLPLIDKDLLKFSLVHRVFDEYFTYADIQSRADMIESLRETVYTMIHTRDGSRVGMRCIWHGTPKDRKIIVKSFAGLVDKICLEEYGHMVLLAVFDSVDDTVVVKKTILTEIIKSLDKIAKDTYGRKVLLYILNPRDPLHFHPDIIKVLQDGDGNINSKKDAEVRHNEILDVVSDKFLLYVKDHSESLTTDNASLLLVLSILTHCHGDPTDAMKAIAEIAARPFTIGSSHIIESMAGHMTFKRLISNDKDRILAGKKELFSRVLLDTLPDGALKSWAACNRGCFTLITLLELSDSEVTSRVMDQIGPIVSSLKKVDLKGAQILVQKFFSSY